MRTKRKPLTTTRLPDSKIKKISGKYSKARAKEVMSFRFTKKPEAKLVRRLVQASTGRTLDYLKIHDEATRRALNHEMQIIVSYESPHSERQIAHSAVETILGNKVVEFFDVFEQIFYSNKSIASYLAKEMADSEINHRRQMN